VSHVLVELFSILVSVRSREHFRLQWLSEQRVRDEEERAACGKLLQTEVAAVEKVLAPMVVGLVGEMTSAVDDEGRSRW